MVAVSHDDCRAVVRLAWRCPEREGHGPKTLRNSSRASGRSATAYASAIVAATLRARNQVLTYPKAGSEGAAPASSMSRPKARNDRAPGRHNRSRSASAGIRSRPAARACGDRFAPDRARRGGGHCARHRKENQAPSANISTRERNYSAAALAPRLASIWPIASTTASKVSSVEACRAL